MVAPPSPPSMTTLPKLSPAQNDEPDLRSALMDSIKKGAVLKKVDSTAPPLSGTPTPSGGRNDLLSEIRKGVELRPVSEEVQHAQIANRVSSEAGTDALADALRRALQERYKHTQSSDDESNNSSENDNEWED